MDLSIDVWKYFKLPPGMRVRFDTWLIVEQLTDKKIVHLRLGEGVITIERFPLWPGELDLVTETIPVSSLPPQDAMRWRPGDPWPNGRCLEHFDALSNVESAWPGPQR